MDFDAALKSGSYCLSLKGDTKQEIIEEMVDLIVNSGKVEDRDEILKAILVRERKMSTGVQHGVAIPHGKTAAVDDLITAVGIKADGVDFESLDGEPSRIFVMTVSSVLDTGPHMEYLAQISRMLNVPSVREQVLAARTRDELIEILAA